MQTEKHNRTDDSSDRRLDGKGGKTIKELIIIIIIIPEDFSLIAFLPQTSLRFVRLFTLLTDLRAFGSELLKKNRLRHPSR